MQRRVVVINGITLKICGLTSVADAQAAATIGADYLGFVLHPASPRYVSLEKFRELQPDLPVLPRVGVLVYTAVDALRAVSEAGFDIIQLHFPNDLSFSEVAQWSDVVPSAKLWFAPRVPPGKEMDPCFAPLAETILWDAYDATQHGGTGRTGDWAAFARQQQKFQRMRWILAGGLNPDNVRDALAQTGATFIDVNSGVESAPGVKDHAKLAALAAVLQ
ncbi:MAG: phosphoribosylanthranilate isomerase [Candidatus Didemnitutus sp.]|nr:phosphoribosylanthranilate isomerase [Candidatus Didemnitutus sp.]